MFDAIKNIAVDRKNSLPVADFKGRYKATGTPVVFGDLTRRWPAGRKWSLGYLKDKVGHVQASFYSNVPTVNHGRPSVPVLNSSLSVYFDELIHRDNDLRVSNMPMESLFALRNDIITPRLGYEFNERLTTFDVAGAGSFEPIRQLSEVNHKVLCHFGEKASVLLIPPSQTRYVYPVGRTGRSIRGINFEQPQFETYPALKKLSAYVATLNHGDSLYIPAGFWYTIAYEGVGVNVSFRFLSASLPKYIKAMSDACLSRIASIGKNSAVALQRLEKRAFEKTNKRLR